MKEKTNSKYYEPTFRYVLKARIYEAGFKTMGLFADRIGIDLSKISRIVNGWEIPSPKIQQKISEELDITVKELRELL